MRRVLMDSISRNEVQLKLRTYHWLTVAQLAPTTIRRICVSKKHGNLSNIHFVFRGDLKQQKVAYETNSSLGALK